MIESLPQIIIEFHAEAQRHSVKRIEWKIGGDQSVVHAEEQSNHEKVIESLPQIIIEFHAEAQRHSVKRIEWKFGEDQSVVHAEEQRH